MSKLFIDADIILDMLLGREYQNEAALLLSMIEEGEYVGCTSPIVFANLHYIVCRQVGKLRSISGLRKLRQFLRVTPIDEETMHKALYSDASDFEDAIQYYAAEKNDVDFIITRNKKHYSKSKIPVLSAKELLYAEKNHQI